MADRRDIKLRVPAGADPELRKILSAFAREIERALNSRPGPQIVSDEPVAEGIKGEVTLGGNATERVLARLQLKSRRPVTLVAQGTVSASSARTFDVRIREGGDAGAIVYTQAVRDDTNSRATFHLTKMIAAPKRDYSLTIQARATGGAPTAYSVLFEGQNA